MKRGCLYDRIAQQREKEVNHLMVILVPSSVLPLLPSLQASTTGKGRHPLSTSLTLLV